MRVAAGLLVAVLCHAGLFGIGALVARSSRSDVSEGAAVKDVEDVEILAARPDPVQEAPATTPERRTSRSRVASRPRGKPRPKPHPTPVALVGASQAEASDVEAALKIPDVAPATSVATSATRPSALDAPRATSNAIVAKPRYRSNPAPDYPPACLRRHEEGVVLVSVQVETDGRPSSISLKQSSGHRLLDDAALDAVRRWTFEPALAGGVPVTSVALVPVRFSTTDR
jgi:protein TonB